MVLLSIAAIEGSCGGQSPCQLIDTQSEVVDVARSADPDLSQMSLASAPELRDDLISFAQDIHGEYSGADFCFYFFKPERFTFAGDKLSFVTVEQDNDDTDKYAASINRKVYLLHGFGSAALNFNRLMLDSHVDVRNGEAALKVFNLYSKVVYGDLFRSRIVGDNLQLIALAAQDFRSRYSSAVRYRRFMEWLNSKEFQGVHPAPPEVREVENRFEIRYKYFKSGRLYPASVFVDSNGRVSDH